MANYDDVEKLNDKELLTLIIRETPESPVISDLMANFDSLDQLLHSTIGEISAIKGLGPKKASQIKAALELGKRVYCSPATRRKQIRSPQDVTDVLMPEMRFLDREHFKVIYLNRKNSVLSIETISIGGLASSLVHPREVFKPAVKRSAAALILAHNHPSGDPTPSQEDINITKRLVESGKLLGIEVLDHIIIGDGRYESFKMKNLF